MLPDSWMAVCIFVCVRGKGGRQWMEAPYKSHSNPVHTTYVSAKFASYPRTPSTRGKETGLVLEMDKPRSPEEGCLQATEDNAAGSARVAVRRHWSGRLRLPAGGRTLRRGGRGCRRYRVGLRVFHFLRLGNRDDMLCGLMSRASAHSGPFSWITVFLSFPSKVLSRELHSMYFRLVWFFRFKS